LPGDLHTAMKSYRHFFQNATSAKAILRFRIKDDPS
jgi:hypothetical protein